MLPIPGLNAIKARPISTGKHNRLWRMAASFAIQKKKAGTCLFGRLLQGPAYDLVTSKRRASLECTESLSIDSTDKPACIASKETQQPYTFEER